MGRISDPEDGKALQNFMICTEMAIAGIALLYAFPHSEYKIGGATAAFRLDAFSHAASIKDVVADAIHVVSWHATGAQGGRCRVTELLPALAAPPGSLHRPTATTCSTATAAPLTT